jgi:D-glycero-alpha-D-manno-heptose 1-phosphate guanylyltransferase
LKIIILAGGLGTRLSGTLGDLPKSLAPIGNIPFLEYLIKSISNQGFTDIVVSSGHRAETIKDYFKDGSHYGLKIEYTFEKELLGTGGAIKLAESIINSDDFIVTNGDTYFEVDLKDMLHFHKTERALATIALSYRDNTGRYGRVIFDKNNKIISFTEKADDGEAGYINGGVYVFRKEIFEYIPYNRVCSLEKEILPLLIGKGLFGFPVNGYFIDIGIPVDYESAKRELPLRRIL